jgi:hypothetical protein
MNSPVERYDERLAPSRLWYVLAVAAALGGFIAMGAFLMVRIPEITSGTQRVLAPGNEEITLDKPGEYTIFHETRSMLNGQVFNSTSIVGLRVLLTSVETGAQVPLGPTSMNSSYSFGSREGHSILGFKIDKPGRYRIATAFDDGQNAPRTVLAISKDFGVKLFTTIIGALGLAFGGIILAAILAVVITRWRRQSTKRII